MPKLMSFAKTTQQIRDRTKTVTRRDGWEDLEEGQTLQAVTKMPFAAPDSWERICLIEVTDVRRERVDAVLCEACDGSGADPDSPNDRCTECHGTGADPYDDVEREGFPGLTGSGFVDFFEKQLGAAPHDEITRIEFRYLDDEEKTDD